MANSAQPDPMCWPHVFPKVELGPPPDDPVEDYEAIVAKYRTPFIRWKEGPQFIDRGAKAPEPTNWLFESRQFDQAKADAAEERSTNYIALIQEARNQVLRQGGEDPHMRFEFFTRALEHYTTAANKGVSAVSDFLAFVKNWQTLSDEEKKCVFKIWNYNQENLRLDEDVDAPAVVVAEDSDDSSWSLSSEISEFEIVECGGVSTIDSYLQDGHI